ncbi:MAG: UDP-glucose 4-epimerase [Thermoplasmata archaeon]|nr:UDP-glucose 4-epimerase [Thermoplasmata archaeon]
MTGGAGFIGSNLVHRLHARGHQPTAVDSLFLGKQENLPSQAPFVKLDCADPAFLETFKGTKWDAVVHLAGASSAPMFEDDPLLAGQAVAAFQNSLEVARGCGAKVAFASTSSLYARSPKPFREDMHVTPGTLYEFSKLAMEELGAAYNARYGLDVSAFRFFSVYGPRERHKGRFANIVSQFMWDLQAGKSPVLYGDGRQTRDFTHVEDLLDGIELCLARTKGFQVYNIGTGIEHDFNQVVAMLNDALGTSVQPSYVPNPVRNYVAETLADNTKLTKLGWKPKIALKEGIARLAAPAAAVKRA